MQRTPLAIALGLLLAPIPALALPEESVLLQEIVVTASRIPQERDHALAEVHVLDHKTLALAGQGSLTDLLQAQPGMEIVGNGGPGQTSSLMLGGYSGGHTLVLIDGLRIGSATLGSSPIEILRPAGFDRVEVLRGAGSHLYGSDAMGGVLHLLTRPGRGEPRLQASVGLGSFDTRSASVGVSGGGERLDVSFEAGYLETDGYDTTNDDVPFAQHNPDKDGFRHNHALLRADLRLNPDHRLSLTGYHTRGVTRYDDGAGANDTRNENREQVLGLTLHSRLLPSWDSQLRVGTGTDKSQAYMSFGYAEYTTRQNQYTWQHDLNRETYRLQAVLERLEQSVGGTVAYTTSRRDNDALALSGEVRRGGHALELAWRHDSSTQYGEQDTGALSYAWRFQPDWRLNLRLASAFKAPAFNDLYYPDDGFAVGNAGLGPERSRSRQLALEGRLGEGQARLACHDDTVEGLILWQFDAGPFRFTPSNVNRARLTGCGVHYDHRLGNWKLRAGLDWQDARDAASDNALPWRTPRRFTLGLQRRTGAWEWSGDLSAAATRHNDSANTQRLPGYALVNLAAAWRAAPDWRIEARLANALDSHYTLVRGYNTPERNLFLTLRYQPR